MFQMNARKRLIELAEPPPKRQRNIDEDGIVSQGTGDATPLVTWIEEECI